MRIVSLVVLHLLALGIHGATGSELEGNAFDDKTQDPLLSVKITLTYAGDIKAFDEQRTNKMGKYGFKEIKKGNVNVTADRADYAFSTETKLIEDMQKMTIDFPGMKRPKDKNHAAAIAGAASIRMQMFDEASVGAEAEWNSLLRYSFEPEELHLIAWEFANQNQAASQNRKISDFAAANPEQLKAAQKQFEAYLAKREDNLSRQDLPPSVVAIMGSRTANAYMDAHGENAETSIRLKKLYVVIAETWNPDVARAFETGVESEKAIRRLRNREWTAEFESDILDGMKEGSLKLRGDVGEINSKDEKIRARLKSIYYIPTRSGVSIQGKSMNEGKIPLWFTINVPKGEEDKIFGDFGAGEKIGAGSSVGSLRGKAMK